MQWPSQCAYIAVSGGHWSVPLFPSRPDTDQCELFQVVLLDETEHKANESSAIEREGDETMVRHERLEKLLQNNNGPTDHFTSSYNPTSPTE